jgi:hypothetical protein
MNNNTDVNQQTRYIPLTQWPKFHPWPGIGGLRHLVFYAKDNGFNNVITRAGRRILIDETAFFNWMKSRNEGQDYV